jgi:uncharacterized repeat protein (TIGR03803 family)
MVMTMGNIVKTLTAILMTGFAGIAGGASAATEKILYQFSGGGDGGSPNGALIFDGQGNLYGAAAEGGKYGAGVVFELSPPSVGQTVWQETVLHSFKGRPDGDTPVGSLARDSQGNLYGSTARGGTYNLGTVFELIAPGVGHPMWNWVVLYSFEAGADGEVPCVGAGLLIDSSGILYGTTCWNGGTGNTGYRNGTVFKLTPPLSGKGAWNKFVLHGFSESSIDGGYPAAQLTFDATGSLYSTTYTGGSGVGCTISMPHCGIVFQLLPTGLFRPWKEIILHNFIPNGVDGVAPLSGVTFDSQGNLYGTTSLGGKYAMGAIYKLTPPPRGKTTWGEAVAWNFSGPDGDLPAYGNLISDKSGNIYGTTVLGGVRGCNCGTVFEYTPGGTLKSLYSFTNTGGDGANPEGGLVMSGAGNLFGTTLNGGVGAGTVFEVTP